ncbi:MAG: type IV secretion system DNA-binding domain-containing protein [Saprospiraceae bacterium]|nr:type IV secretion system DNA-binding domain-containing protein [Saprospiraceae bacterium]
MIYNKINGQISAQKYGLDHPLIKFSDNQKDWWTLRDAVRGVHIFGGIGAGKTSSSGKKIAKEFLKLGMGGIVCCAKSEEREEFQNLVQHLYTTEGIDRRADLIIFSEDSSYSFNPLKYEKMRSGKGAGESFNLVNLLMNIYQMGKNLSGDSGSHSGDRFWDNALKRLIRRMIDLLKLSEEDVSIQNMHALVVTLLSKDEAEKLKSILANHDTSKQHLKSWGEQNYYIKCFLKATLNTSKAVEKDENTTLLREYFIVKNYFNREIITLAERTRTIITESFLGIVEPFLTGLLYKHFVQDTTILPEWTHEGKIIILDFSVKEYLELGIYAQGIFKLMWQQATERRSFKAGRDLPIFCWCDEAQFFLSDYDSVFQTTARSSGACTVLLSQNISNYLVTLGGNAQAKVDSLLGNLCTKIYHANNDAVTNEWAARTIGKDVRQLMSFNVSNNANTSSGISQQLHYQVEPREFTTLRSGGNENNFIVDTIITVAGKEWSDGKNFTRKSFKQIF